MLPKPGNNQYGPATNFKISEPYLKKLGFKRLFKEDGRCYAFPARYGAIVVTLLEGTRIHIRGISKDSVITTGKFNGNCKDENEFLDRLEFLLLL